DKDDWGSLDRGNAEKGVGTSFEIKVPTITLHDLIDLYGHPYYIKCDIEGGDYIFVRQLHQSPCRPAFVSIEATSVEDIAMLGGCGYDRFKIFNQYLPPLGVPPRPARGGNFFKTRFPAEMSGLFGRDLPADKWTNLGGAIDRYVTWRRLKDLDERLA